MDIYFCDLCGVRVTDVDLRGGHGIRRVDDVICATCLELGHGKEWLVQHNRVRQSSSTSMPPVVKSKAPGTAASAGSPASARPAAAAGKAKESPTVDAGRDRARTVEEDEPEIAPVTPRIIGDIEGIATAATVPDNEAEAAVQERAAPPARRPANARGSDFAAAASGFSALGSQPTAPARHGADDLREDSGGNRELTAEEAEHHDTDGDAEDADIDHQAGLETADGRDERRAAEGAETADGEAPSAAGNGAASLSREAQEAATDENDPAEAGALKISGPPSARRPAVRPGATSASSTRTPAGRPSTGRIAASGSQGRPGAKPAVSSTKNARAGNSSTKNAAAKSGKGGKSSVRAKARADNKKVFLISAISISVLVIIMIGVSVNRSGRHPVQKVETVNISKELVEHIKSANAQASKALSSEDIKQLDSARTTIDAVMVEVEAYSKFAEEHGRSQEEIGQALNDARLPALKSLTVDIGHKKVELNQR